jgi:hypothetical protein
VGMGVVSRKPPWRPARRRELKPTALFAIRDYFIQRAVPGLSLLPGSVWLRPGAAKVLCALDRAAGGWYHVLQSEFKRCALCARPLLGAAAETVGKCSRVIRTPSCCHAAQTARKSRTQDMDYGRAKLQDDTLIGIEWPISGGLRRFLLSDVHAASLPGNPSSTFVGSIPHSEDSIFKLVEKLSSAEIEETG